MKLESERIRFLTGIGAVLNETFLRFVISASGRSGLNPRLVSLNPLFSEVVSISASFGVFTTAYVVCFTPFAIPIFASFSSPKLKNLEYEEERFDMELVGGRCQIG